MHPAWKLVAGLAAAVFIVVGLAWLVAPGFVAAQMRMPLLDGDGLSTQVADLASFFLTLGSAISLGLATGRAFWLYPAIMLLAFGAMGRIIAWLAHGATLPIDMVAVEVGVIVVLVVTALRMPVKSA